MIRNIRSVLIIIVAIIPIAYIGWLLYYFLDTAGSIEEAQNDGLGPTILGLSIVGGLFVLALVVKLIRIFASGRPPASSGGSGPTPRAPDDDGDSGFDADAVFARYMAKNPGAGAPTPSAPPRARQGRAPGTRPTFGRKTG